MRRWPLPLVLACGAIAWLTVTWLFPDPTEQHPFHFPQEASWITAAKDGEEPQASAGFRLDFQVPPITIERAWIAVAADSGVEVIVNGNPVVRWDLYRPTRPFQAGHSRYGQKLRYAPSALSLNYPREFQWSDNANWKLPLFVDITSQLITGHRNALCVIAHARHEEPAFRLTGEILLSSGRRIPLHSNPTWRSIKTPETLFDREWQNQRYLADSWPFARLSKPRPGQAWRFPPPGVFELPFAGQWLQVPMDGSRHTFATSWTLDQPCDKAFVRVASDADYLLKVNGTVLRPLGGAKRHPAEGEWIARPLSRRILSVPPELLDPGEGAQNYLGEEFLSPRHGDPTENEYAGGRDPLDLSQDSFTSEQRGNLLTKAGESKPARPTENDGTGEAIRGRSPVQTAHARGAPSVTGFEVTHWLKRGENQIEIITLPPVEGLLYQRARRMRLALDAGVVSQGAPQLALSEGTSWTRDGQPAATSRAAVPGVMKHAFRRIAQPEAPGRWFPMAIMLLALFTGHRWPRELATLILVLGVVSGCGLLLEVTMRERSEELWMTGFPAWRGAVLVLGALTAFAVSQIKKGNTQADGRGSAWYRVVLLGVLVLAFVARAYELDIQALDDDEYASVQATLSIAKKGVPEIAPGIYYTRGPFYHYAASLFVILFGENIWALRLPAILAGVLSVFFTYLLGSRLLESRAMGIAASLLVALNPFCIFTSHIARFYQQQQTLTVATVYFFISGFVQHGKPWHRAAAVICAGLAVLSQEISLLIAVPFGFCYALMARPAPLRNEIKLALVVCLTGGVVFLNLLVFKVVCLTRLDGISPNVESTLKPHFYEPLNFLSMWLGYSRLHVFLGVFSLIGMLAGFRKREPGMIAVTFFLVIGIVGTVLLVTATGFRYQYSVLPLWVVTAAYGIRVVSAQACGAHARPALVTLGCTIIGFGILSYSPWRIPSSYHLRILGDSSGATSYVRAHLREGDAVAITEPHPHAALLETGRADYDIAVPILYDFVYRDAQGRLIDRNGGAESMGRLGTLQRAMAQHDRIWILLNREKFRTRGRNLRWEYPGARFDLFVRNNCRLTYRAYLWDVYLWDRATGKLDGFRAEPEGWND